MTIPQISRADAAGRLDWPGAVEALRAGHLLPRAEIADMLLGGGALLSRGARIEGLGFGVKSVTVFDANPRAGLPTIQGAMLVFEPGHGRLEAIVDNDLVTGLKTAADSVLGASLLARTDSRHLLVVGAGEVAGSLLSAYPALFPGLTRISVWARRAEQAEALAATAGAGPEVVAVTDLASAAATADIVACATMARKPVLRGAWLRPGTHVDLSGAFTPEMREADDDLIGRAALFVDCRETTIRQIGELSIPIARGVIGEGAIRGALDDLVTGAVPGRRSTDEITVFKNGGGAHLDLMIARYITGRVLPGAQAAATSQS